MYLPVKLKSKSSHSKIGKPYPFLKSVVTPKKDKVFQGFGISGAASKRCAACDDISTDCEWTTFPINVCAVNPRHVRDWYYTQYWKFLVV